MGHDLKECIMQFPSPPYSYSIELINSACLMHKTGIQKRKTLFRNNSYLLKRIWLIKSPFDPITASSHVPRRQRYVGKAFWKQENCNYVLQDSSLKSWASPWRFQWASSAHARNPKPTHHSDTHSLTPAAQELRKEGRKTAHLKKS